MKSFILAVLFCSFFIGCREGREKSAVEQEKSREEEVHEQERLRNEKKTLEQEFLKNNVVREFVEEFFYFKDSRTDVCFVFARSKQHGAPTLATVPCEKIPEKMLVVIK